MNDFLKIKDVNINDKPEIALKFQNIQIKKTTANADYASLIGYDGEDLIEVKIWALTKEKKDILKTGEVYIATGVIKDYQGKKQFNVTDFRVASAEEVHMESFYQYAPMSVEKLKTEISRYVSRMQNKILKEIVLKVINKYVDEYFSYPAAITIHHSFISGLAYHAYSMLVLSETYLNLYSYLNRDLVYAGIILHDIGKTKELSGAKGAEYTKSGNLLGHISIGASIVNRACEDLKYENTEEALALEHIILSHHGFLEYGSPKEPLIPEAVLVFLLDYGDSRLAALEKPCTDTEKGESTDPIVAFDRRSFYIPKI